MINKLNPSEVMEIFNEARNKTSDMQHSLNTLMTNLETKMNVLSSEYEYITQKLSEIATKVKENYGYGRIVLADSTCYGEYDTYGITIHPKLAKIPRNIFNYSGAQGNIFKNNITVFINGEESEDYKHLFMHDSIESKKQFVAEMPDNEFTMSLEVKDIGLGDTNFNVIELCPFMSGSFDISKISIYEYSAGNAVLSHELTDVKNVAMQRIVLSDYVKLYKIEFSFKLKYKNSNDKYIFGIKHIYFLKANFVKDSYIICECSKCNYNINYIYDRLIVNSQFGDIETSITNESGEVYREYSDGVLSHELDISTTLNPQYITSNIKKFYLKLPVTTSLISILPTIITEADNSTDI